MATVATIFDRLHSEFDFDCRVEALAPAEARLGRCSFVFPELLQCRAWLRKTAAALSLRPPAGKKETAVPHAETVVLLIAFRPASVHFAEQVFPLATEVRIFWDHLVLDGYEEPAKFPFCAVVFRRRREQEPQEGLRRPEQTRLTRKAVSIQLPSPARLDRLLERCEAHLAASHSARFAVCVKAAERGQLASAWPTPAFICSRIAVREFYQKAAAEAGKPGAGPVYRVVPCRSEARYFVTQMLSATNGPAQVWFVSPNLIHEGFDAKCPQGSVVLIWNASTLPQPPIVSQLTFV